MVNRSRTRAARWIAGFAYLGLAAVYGGLLARESPGWLLACALCFVAGLCLCFSAYRGSTALPTGAGLLVTLLGCGHSILGLFAIAMALTGQGLDGHPLVDRILLVVLGGLFIALGWLSANTTKRDTLLAGSGEYGQPERPANALPTQKRQKWLGWVLLSFFPIALITVEIGGTVLVVGQVAFALVAVFAGLRFTYFFVKYYREARADQKPAFRKDQQT